MKSKVRPQQTRLRKTRQFLRPSRCRVGLPVWIGHGRQGMLTMYPGPHHHSLSCHLEDEPRERRKFKMLGSVL